jgi:hypothetical protein
LGTTVLEGNLHKNDIQAFKSVSEKSERREWYSM